MAKYHNFAKFVDKKHYFGTNQWSTTFLVIEFDKLEFLEVLPLWHSLTWHSWIKKYHLVLKFIGLEYCVTVYLGFYNSSMARVNYFHNANSYSSSLDSSMAELLNTLFQNYSYLVLLSHLYQKKSYSLITLTFSISLSLSQSRYHLTLTLPHALNLPLSHIAHWLLGFSRLESTPSVLVLVLRLISLLCSNISLLR